MNPGDVYRPPSGNSQRPSDPYAPPAPYNPYPPAPTPSGNNRYQTPSPNPYQSHQSPPPNQNPYQSPPPHHSAPPPVPQNPFQHPLEADAGQYNSHAAPLPTSPSLNSVYNIPPSFSGLAPQYSTGDMSYPPQNHTPGPGQEDDDAAFPLLNNGAPNIGMRPSPSPGPGYGGPPTFAPYNGQQFSDQPMDSPYAQDESLIRYGPLPARVQRRRTKRVKHNLTKNGHFVQECPVPSRLLDQCPIKDGYEFSTMRYTAVTGDPDDFDKEFDLRQVSAYSPRRQTELFIVVTMYNEDDVLFSRTMKGVMQNIAHLCERNKSKTWGNEGWKKVCVCIISDGRLKINPRTRSVLAGLGVYQDGVAKNAVNGQPTTAHLYEYTTQFYINGNSKITKKSGSVPIQLIFCLKEKNQKKINSHRWFFNAFGKVLNPNVCVLLDVGTQPGPSSIYHLWKVFDLNSNVGGACGEIVALKGKFMRNLLNPLVAAQNFEYKMSNILDKPLESIFGYITVLPGAFSAYRYMAIQNDASGQGPLQKYFFGETMHGAGAGIFKANMYLAEDRILCWELVSKRASRWTLHYVKSAYAITDVPDRVPELVSQRRRWLNGSFFAAIHSIAHFGYLYRSDHSFIRKFFLHIEFIYQVINNVFAWFALGNYFIAFYILVNSMGTYGKAYEVVGTILKYCYVALLLVCFILALGNRPQGSVVGYTVSMIGFALITCYMIFAAVYLAVKGIQTLADSAGNGNIADAIMKSVVFRNIVVSLLATYGLYIVSSLLAFDPWHLLTSFIQYLLIAPSYINVLNVYAFSNVHDVSWGTKGSDKVSDDLGVVKSDPKNHDEIEVDELSPEDLNLAYDAELRALDSKPPPENNAPNAEQKQEDYYKNFRTNVLLVWVITNAGLVAGILQPSNTIITENGQKVLNTSSVSITYMGVMLYTVAGLAAFRFLGSCVYLIVRLFAGE